MMEDLFSQDNGMSEIPSMNLQDHNKDKNTSANAAAYLEKPEPRRGESKFVGLINQGGTCYMNSSLFVLYINPILRQIIYDFPLCDNNDISIQSNFVADPEMYKILISLQKLFGSLQYLNVHSVSTKELTEAFGWNNIDTNDHHDNQEFIRQFLECLDDVLQTTAFAGVINNLYRIVNINYLTCTNCNFTKSFQEFCLDINVPVQGVDGLFQALDNTYNNYDIINDYHCSSCDKRVDLKKGNKISQLPYFLTFFLNRLSYDLYTGDRIKIGSKFEFPLEIDMRPYLSDEMKFSSQVNQDENLYELYGIIIHNGNPHRGHYFAYIRDLDDQGQWNLSELNEFKREPTKFGKDDEGNDDIENKIENTLDVTTLNETKFDIINNVKDAEKRVDNEKQGKKNKNRQNIENNKKDKNTKNNNKQNQCKNKNKLNAANSNKSTQKKNADNEDNYKKLNFDECDHPLPYTNKNLSKGWFEFNDTTIYPIRVGKLRKQFQSSESAYSLFYIKKSVQTNKCEAPEYLKRYFDDLNQNLEIKRKEYEEEQQSLNITIFDFHKNFFIDEFGILSLKENINLEKIEDNKLNLKLKFYNKFQNVLDTLKEQKKILSPSVYDLTKDEEEDIILYEIVHNRNTNDVMLISKLDSSNKECTLEHLKICHNSRFILLNKKQNYETPKLFETLNNSISLEPISIHIICGAVDKTVRIFGNLNLEEFKNYLKSFFNLNYEISVVYKNNNKILDLDKIAFNSKTNEWNNMKNLLHNKNLLFVTRRVHAENEFDEESEKNLENQLDEEITCIVRIEESKDIQVVKIKLNQTFQELVEKIKNELKIDKNYFINDDIKKSEIENENQQFPFRIRKEYDGNIIFKNLFNNKLNSDETFLDGGVRLKIEFGEPYESCEVLLNIYMVIENEKVVKDFIGDPEKISLLDLKKFICEEFAFKFEDYMFYSTNAFCDPVKAIKNENQTLKKLGLKDCDSIFLKNISVEQNETFNLKIYKPSNGKNSLLEDTNFVFKPVTEDLLVNELFVNKDTKLSQIKETIVNNLNLSLKHLDFLRLRVLNKRMDPEKILSGNDVPIKKLNLENKANLMIEILDAEENLKKNQIQLYLWKRDSKNKSYYNKLSVLFEFENTATSDQLYELCRRSFNLRNISIAKYSKHNYIWEFILEMNDDGPINLRKMYGLKDGDWIGVREDKENEYSEDDFQTNEDRKTLLEIKNLKISEGKETNSRKNRTVEKPLRIPKFSK